MNSRRFTIRITDEQQQALDSASQQSGMQYAEIINEALGEYLSKNFQITYPKSNSAGRPRKKTEK